MPEACPLQFPPELPTSVSEAFIVPTILVILALLGAQIPRAQTGQGIAILVALILLAMVAGHLGAILRRLRHLEELISTLPRTPPELPEELPPGDVSPEE